MRLKERRSKNLISADYPDYADFEMGFGTPGLIKNRFVSVASSVTSGSDRAHDRNLRNLCNLRILNSSNCWSTPDCRIKSIPLSSSA